MKHPANNGKIIHMSKITEYFYIFSKLTTSLVLIIIIFIMGYALFKSYKEVDDVAIDLDSKIETLSNLLNSNKDNVSDLSKKITNSENQIIEIKKILKQNNENVKNTKNDKEINNLVQSIEILQEQINQITSNYVIPKNDSKNNVVETQSKQINSLIALILKKYQNGESVKGEIALLEKLIPNKKEMFEKLSLIELKKFYGIKNLNNEFNISVNKYINFIFIENNKSSAVNFLLKFITIKPNNLNNYKDENLNILMQAKELMEKENFQESLNLILLIDNKQKFFYKWIEQIRIYLEFNNIMNRAY